MTNGVPPALNPLFCRERQSRALTLAEKNDLAGLVFFNRFYIHALTGYWHPQPLTPVALWLARNGRATLIAHGDALEARAIDDVVSYSPQHLFTLKENLPGCVAGKLNSLVRGTSRIGTDQDSPAAMMEGPVCLDVTTDYQEIRRRKDPDEVDLLKFTIDCANQAYLEAQRIIAPGITETEVMAAMLHAATRAAGEVLSGFGQDYQCGVPGGLARRRAIESGEIFILDVGIGVRGYRSDLCRSFAVSDASPQQRAAHARILEQFPLGERLMMPGASCRKMFEIVSRELDGWNGYRFFHHVGHGIGLDAHECPRINPHWDDSFEVDDVVAFEPALYDDTLRGGIRLENNYLITLDGPEKLSHFPLSL